MTKSRERPKGLTIAAALALAVLGGTGALSRADAETPPAPAGEPEIFVRTRAVLADIQAFEQLNQEIVKLCREPVKGSYADFREDFREDLERTRELERLASPAPADLAAVAARSVEEMLKPFRDAGEQELYARCLRWGTALIQRESHLRADISAKFAFLKANAAAIRAARKPDAR